MDELAATVSRSQTLRFAVVGMLVLVMLIPLAFVQGVSEERQRYFEQAAAEIARSWGGQQSLAGPFLVVPEIHGSASPAAGERAEPRRVRVLLPRSLDVSVEVRHQMRTRGIHEVAVYHAVVRFSGELVLPHAAPGVHRLTDEAQVLLGIADTHAVEAVSELELAGARMPFGSGTGQPWLGEGVHADAVVPTPNEPVPFHFQITLRGSGTFGVAPVGASNEITMSASWPHPSFTGRFLPREHEIAADGFTATWVVHELARGLPGNWVQGIDQVSLQDGYASVSLFQPVTAYTRVDRGIKYGVLFIGLTFVAFVCFEMLTPVRFHYVQYVVVGGALVLFYLTLLSLSETLPFRASYVIAALLLDALVTWYVWMITRRPRLAAGVCGILGALYLCLYVLLELEDYALLVGTAVLLGGLFALMYATSRLERP